MYGKIFAQIYDGTLREHWQALVTFQQLIVLSDVEGVVDMTPEALSGRTGIPLEVIEAGLAVLESTDQASRTPDEEGRRIVRLSPNRAWGWRIVNYRHYCDLREAVDRREYHKQYWHRRKKTQPNSTVEGVEGPLSELRTQPNSPHSTDVSVSVDVELPPTPRARGDVGRLVQLLPEAYRAKVRGFFRWVAAQPGDPRLELQKALSTVDGSLRGLGMEGMRPASYEAIALALADFPDLKMPLSPANLRSCIGRAERDLAKGEARRTKAAATANDEDQLKALRAQAHAKDATP